MVRQVCTGAIKQEKFQFPQTLREAMAYFAYPDKGHEFMICLRWPEAKVTCPHCKSEKVSFLSTRQKWKCMNKECHKQFSAKVGTIFEDSALGYDKWFPAIWMIVNAKNGISSYEIARALGVTQKTAWFMLHRIRLAMQTGTFEKMGWQVEADETYVGGAARFHHKHKRFGRQRWSTIVKIPGAGVLERGTRGTASQVKGHALNRVPKGDLVPFVERNVEKGSQVFTGAFPSFWRLDKKAYLHEMIDHAVAYVQGHVPTNGMENFWSLLKRTLKGAFVSVDPVQLFRFLDEQPFRFKERTHCEAGRPLKAPAGIVGRGIRYLELIGGKGDEDLPPQIVTAG